MTRRLTSALALLFAFLLAALPARAQRYVARADSLLRQGRVSDAEQLYYYAVRKAPRDPAARLALGRYLAARGALRIGAVLMEEARFFGGDAKLVGTYLAPVYARLGDYKALTTLPGSPLPYAQRARAEWLTANVPATTGPDSAVVPLVAADSAPFGAIAIVLGHDTLAATIDPRVQGLTLDTAWLRRKDVKRFSATYDADWRNAAGVALTTEIGPFVLTNVPATFAVTGSERKARVGLDFLGGLAPTIDQAAGTLLLRRSGRITTPPSGERIPTLVYPGGLWIVQQDGVWPLGGAAARATLGGRPWILDAKRGDLILLDR
ncbi:MAG TPA: hypothetical protein VF761_17550 [Gemmatimonadaceae bacterium]